MTTPFALQRMERIVVMLLLVSSLAVRGVSSKPNTPFVEGAELIEEHCPPCEILFGKLERTGRDGKLAQDVRMQERGEPKSGTGVLYSWSTSALMHACDYLQDLFGQQSCRIETHDDKGSNNVHDFAPHGYKTMAIFEPSLGGADARCSCETIDRVSITTSETLKHRLPVDTSCAFSHGVGIGVGDEESDESPSGPPCTFADGAHVTNHSELWRCMHEAYCEINDDWLQMAIFRDPRPGIVSTFFHIEAHAHKDLGDLDAFVVRELPILCQWLAVRYILFVGILGEQSTEFWYEDAMVDPMAWHYQWLFSVGLQLPFNVVEATAQAAASDNLGFKHKDVDKHPGEEKRTDEGVRLFEDEVSPETLEIADSVLRAWLPPVLLERFGVEP